MKETFLSIILPVFNVAPFLRECLDSIISQGTEGIEIILIDDGSTDGSETICDDYSRDHSCVKVFHKSNEGVGIARNLGIEKASGQWISFVDPDDSVAKNYISSFYSLTRNSDLVFFSLTLETQDGRKKYKVLDDVYYEGASSMQKGIFQMMFNNQRCEFFAFTVNKFFKSAIIRQNNIRFVPRLTFREDELFSLDYYFCIHCFETSSLCLYNYRIDLPDSLSHKKKTIGELLLYADQACLRFSQFTDPDLRSAEFTRLLHFLVNAFEPSIPDEDYIRLVSCISSLIHNHYSDLAHLKKTRLFNLVLSLPAFLSHPIMKSILVKIYKDNQRNDTLDLNQDPLW